MSRPLSTRSAAFLGLAATLLVTALLYAPGLGTYFVADDFRYLELAGTVRSLPDVLPHIQGACTRIGWPVVILAFWIGRAVGGLQPEAYRLLALGVHLANALLVFILARRVLGAQGIMAALASAIVLALHPRQHESVMWLSTFTWSAGTAFSLLAATGYVAWRQAGRVGWLALMVVAAALAMISNPSALVLPAIFACYDILRRSVRPATFVVLAGLLALLAALGMVCGLGQLPNSGDRSSYGLALSGLRNVGVFLAYVIWPVPWNLKELITGQPLLGYLAAALALGAVVLAAAVAWLRGGLLARWGLLWTVLAVLPPALFSAFLSDHYMSLMLVGVALTCAGIVHDLPRRWVGTALVVAAIWVMAALPQIAIKVHDWQAAGQITTAVRDETLARYPAVANGTRFFYIGLPETRERVVIWSYGIDSAVRLWYNNTTLRAIKNVQFDTANEPLPTDLVLDFSGRW